MSGAIASVAMSAYDLAFQVSPIILQGGIANGILGGSLPIIQLTGQLAGLLQGIASSGTLTTADFPVHFVPLPGSTIINNAIANYTFANQQTAANAIVQQPNTLSLMMIAPVNAIGGYFTKLAILTSLRNSLQQHNQAGGWYSVAMPALIHGPCLMTGMTDITGGQTKQQQIMWQIDFSEPLITLPQAAAAQSSMMSAVSGGQQISGIPSWSGAAAAVGSASQGALAGTLGATGLTGAVNTVLTSAPQL